MVPRRDPTFTVCPFWTAILPNTPLEGAGTSTLTLSVSNSNKSDLRHCDYWINNENFIVERRKKLFDLKNFKLKGHHNTQNLLLAVAAARKIGLSPEEIKDSLRSYKQLPHRLETIHQNNKLEIINIFEKNGKIKYCNDHIGSNRWDLILGPANYKDKQQRLHSGWYSNQTDREDRTLKSSGNFSSHTYNWEPTSYSQNARATVKETTAFVVPTHHAPAKRIPPRERGSCLLGDCQRAASANGRPSAGFPWPSRYSVIPHGNGSIQVCPRSS